MAKFDLILRGGRVIDPASGLDAAHDIAVKTERLRRWRRGSRARPLARSMRGTSS